MTTGRHLYHSLTSRQRQEARRSSLHLLRGFSHRRRGIPTELSRDAAGSPGCPPPAGPLLFQTGTLRQRDRQEQACRLPDRQPKTTHRRPFRACKGCPGQSLGVRGNGETAKTEGHLSQFGSASTQPALGKQGKTELPFRAVSNYP